MRENKKALRIAVLIIPAVLVLLALYSFTNSSDQAQQALTAEGTDEQTESAGPLETEGGKDEIAEVKRPEGKTAVTESTTSTEKSLQFFLDRDRDGQKNGGETICAACTGREVLMGGGLESLEEAMRLESILVGSGAKLTAEDASQHSRVWGVIPEGKLLVGVKDYGFGDGSNDIEVPVWEYTGIVSAVNAGVTGILREGGSAVYIFDKLIPSMRGAYLAQEAIWVKLTPDTTVPDKYYLFPTRLESSGTSYLARVNWEILMELPQVEYMDNLEFVVL